MMRVVWTLLLVSGLAAPARSFAAASVTRAK
jgi:hypothetical protein